jgi:hypothetical protein
MKARSNQYMLVFHRFKDGLEPIEELYFDRRAEALDHAARFSPAEGVTVVLKLIRTWSLEKRDFYQGGKS